MNKKYKSLKKATNSLILFSLLAILSYRLDAIRYIFKSLSQWIESIFKIPNFTKCISVFYPYVELLCAFVVFLCILCNIFICVKYSISDRKKKSCQGDNGFEQSIFRYLNSTSSGRCYLITGQWGSGKTYILNEFLNKHFSSSKRNIFRISCFGLSSRKDIIDEINKVIERSDDSISGTFSQYIIFLPVVGEFLCTLFKKSYSFASVKKDSIFIFDDFERITARSIDANSGNFLRNRHNSRTSRNSELQNILDNINDIRSSITSMYTAFTRRLDKEDLDKYVSIIGIINEMVEVHGLKVIIVCSADMLGEKFVNDILRSKLNCIEYRKTVTEAARQSLLKSTQDSFKLINAEKQSLIYTFLDSVDTNLVIQSEPFGNLRIYRNLIEAFILTADLFEKEVITTEFLESLFVSILITHYCYYSKNIPILSAFQTGVNTSLLISVFSVGPHTFEKTTQSFFNGSSRWIDLNISGYWILNLTRPSEANNIADIWSRYPYIELEKELISQKPVSPLTLTNYEDYDFIHLIFTMGRSAQTPISAESSSEYIADALKNHDLTDKSDLRNIFDIMSHASGIFVNSAFENAVFKYISDHNNKMTVEGASRMAELYNAFCKKKTTGKLHKNFL